MLFRFESVPVVTFIGCESPPQGFADAKCFPEIAKETAMNVAGYLEHKIAETCIGIDKVFASFDVDKSGTVDKHELKAVAQELGLNMNGNDVSNMINDLDLNKDGLISPEEF